MALHTAGLTLFILVLASAAMTEALLYESREHCRQEIKQHRLTACRSFMQQQGGHGSVLLTDAGEVMMEDRGVLQKCCLQLGEVSEGCRCDAIRMMVRDLQQEGWHGGRQMMEKMERTALHLPTMCGMGPDHCTMRGGGGSQSDEAY